MTFFMYFLPEVEYVVLTFLPEASALCDQAAFLSAVREFSFDTHAAAAQRTPPVRSRGGASIVPLSACCETETLPKSVGK